jgi:gluconolactonase
VIVSGPDPVAAISGGVDGLGRDCAGNLYVTNNGNVVVLDRSDRSVGSLSANGATNVAFGGSDRRTLYVTSLGDPPALRSAVLDVPGLPY